MSNITRKEWQDKQYAIALAIAPAWSDQAEFVTYAATPVIDVSNQIMEGIYGECPEDNE